MYSTNTLSLTTNVRILKNVLDWSRSFLDLTRAAERFETPPTDVSELAAYRKTFYYDPFVGQLTANELRTLNSGGFLQATSHQFDQDKL